MQDATANRSPEEGSGCDTFYFKVAKEEVNPAHLKIRGAPLLMKLLFPIGMLNILVIVVHASMRARVESSLIVVLCCWVLMSSMNVICYHILERFLVSWLVLLVCCLLDHLLALLLLIALFQLCLFCSHCLHLFLMSALCSLFCNRNSPMMTCCLMRGVSVFGSKSNVLSSCIR